MAVLKFKTHDEIPSDLREVAEEISDGDDKGQWKVKVSAQSKLDEFRENNVALAKKMDTAVAELEGLKSALGLSSDEKVDVDALTSELGELRTTDKLVKDGKLSKSEDIEKEVEKRTDNMRKTLEEGRTAAQKVAEAEKRRADDNEGKYRRTFIDRDVYSVCTDTEAGVEHWAIPYILQDAYTLYHVEGESNKLVPKRDGGIVYGESGGEPMTLQEWINGEVRKSKPHFFKKSGGGGASGGGDAGQKFGGMSKDDFDKLPASRRLAIANEIEAKQRARK